MDSYRILVMAHVGVAILLFGLAFSSVLTAVQIAVKPDSDRANIRLRKRANTIGIIENLVAIIVTLSGLILVYLGPWSLSQAWLLGSLAIMVFYCSCLLLVTKPKRDKLATGGTAVKAGMQVILQNTFFLLLVVNFALMLIKPGSH